MDFYDVVKNRRSVRRFTDEPVPRDVLERIVQAGIDAPSGLKLQNRQFVIVDDPGVLGKMRPMSNAMETSPGMIVLLMDPKATKYGEFWVQDASAAMENMLLAAVAEGYGACWVEGGMRPHQETIRKLLDVPASLHVWSLVSLGKAAQDPPRPPKSQLADVLHYNHFG